MVTEALVVLDEEPRDGGDRPERSGVLRRLLVSGEAGRRGSWAMGLGTLGGAAFLASLLLSWQTFTPPRGVPDDQFVGASDASGPVSVSIGDMPTFGMIYMLGGIALLALAGAAVSRPEAAGRLRFAVAGGALGLIAVLLAISTRLADQPLGTSPVSQFFYGGVSTGDSLYQLAVGPGLFAGYAAVVLPTVAIWLAAKADDAAPAVARFTRRPAAVDRVAEAAAAVTPDVVGPAALPEYQRRNNQGPLDLTVTPG